MPTFSEITLAKILGNLYTEVFQRRQISESEAIRASAHALDTVDLAEKVFTLLDTSTNRWAWGPAPSDQVNVDLRQGVWSQSTLWS